MRNALQQGLSIEEAERQSKPWSCIVEGCPKRYRQVSSAHATARLNRGVCRADCQANGLKVTDSDSERGRKTRHADEAVPLSTHRGPWSSRSSDAQGRQTSVPERPRQGRSGPERSLRCPRPGVIQISLFLRSPPCPARPLSFASTWSDGHGRPASAWSDGYDEPITAPRYIVGDAGEGHGAAVREEGMPVLSWGRRESWLYKGRRVLWERSRSCYI